MQNQHIDINIVEPILRGHGVYSVSVNTARRFSICSLILCVINPELKILSARIPPTA